MNDTVMGLPAALLASDAFLLGKTRTRLVRRLAEGHARLGLRQGHGSILVCLAECGPLSQRDLAGMLDVDPSDLVRAVDAFEAIGLVRRQTDPDDRRRNIVSLTTAGDERRQRYEAMIAEVEESFFGGIPPADHAVFSRVLYSLAQRED